MANYSAIKATVNAYIKQNGKKEITGHILNSVLNATIDSLGRYFQFAGGAMPTDDPGTPDQNVCYLAGEPGVYTNFGGITVENEEVALLFWDGEWTKQRVLLGIQEVEASVDNQVGTPSVDVSYSGGQLVLTFHNLKGEQGIQGDAAGFGTIGADINEGVGTPGVSVETSGDNTAKNLMFHFTNLKGDTGVTSVVATIDDTSGTPSCQVSLVNGVLTLAFSGLKGLKGDTGVSADYPITLYNGLDSDATDQALAAAQGKVLDGKISQLRQDVSVNGMQKSEYAYSHFTARETDSASVTLGTDILLTTEGDYIEIKVRAKANGYILRRPTSYNPPNIRYSSQNTLQVRFNPTTSWAKQGNALDWNEVQIIKVYLDSISGTTYNFNMYVNDTLLGTQAVTDPRGLNQIAYGNTNIDMDIYYIETKIGGVVSRLDKFAEMAGATYVTDVYTTGDVPSLSELDTRASNLEADVTILKEMVIGEDMYYSYLKSVSTYNISSAFYIYQRLKDNIYTRTTIGYYNYSGSAGYPNGYWRIERINIGTIINNVWTDIQNQAITAGENEFVLKWLAGSDYNFNGGFSGGFHFGETIDNIVGAWVEFVADGNRLSTEEDIPLTPCKSFYYREYSPIFQHKDDTIAAWHLKETEFKDGGYETINDVKFVQALDYFAYPGIVCVSRWLSEKAMPEGVETITDMGDGSTTIAEQFKSNGHRIHYEGNGYMCDVESEVLIGADDAQCQRVVYNSSAYNKFYRRNPDTEGSENNRLKGRTKVKISAM